MELCGVLKEQEEDSGKGKKNLPELLMDEAHPEEEDEDEEVEEKGTKTQQDNQNMPAEEQTATSDAGI